MPKSAASIALTRFGMGPRPGDLDAAETDPRGVIMSEIAGGNIDVPGAGDLPDSVTAIRLLRQDMSDPSPTPAGQPAMTGDAGEPQDALPSYQRIFRSEVAARVRAGIATSPGFIERLTLFWSNHFAVSAAKGSKVRVVVGAFEREAIRPHVLGRFSDMLQAAVLHQAMLTFLDNDVSIGPNSPAGRRRDRGYNENLAREVLELHTIGVDGGQTQEDVTALALILTGWTVLGPDVKSGRPGETGFNVNRHEPGDFTLLGKVYPDGGREQAQTALLDLARHPATARFVAGKFARHFVSDEVPPTLVDRLAEVFAETDGDLTALSVALLDSPEAWDTRYRKLRSPYEFLLAAHRLCGLQPRQAGLVLTSLRAMGQQAWSPAGPDGFPDSDLYWGSGQGLKSRLAVAVKLAERSQAEPADLIEAAFGEDVSGDTRGTIMKAGDRQQATALLLMSPEFQWR